MLFLFPISDFGQKLTNSLDAIIQLDCFKGPQQRIHVF